MSTHFRPHPPSTTPSSPTRPSTAHSSIRAVSPSPSNSVFGGRAQQGSVACMRRKQTCYAQYSTDRHASNKSKFDAKGSSLYWDLLAAGTMSPAKLDQDAASIDRPCSVSARLPSQQNLAEHDHMTSGLVYLGQKENQETLLRNSNECPETPTPMPCAQRRTLFRPVQTPSSTSSIRGSSQINKTGRRQTPAAGAFRHLNYSYYQDSNSPALPSNRSSYSLTSAIAPLTIHESSSRKFKSYSSQDGHVSVSVHSNFSGATVASRRSVFSTLGRDEMERKKTAVEEDEGPFGQAKTLADLQEQRCRLSSGRNSKGRKNHIGFCVNKCNVM